MVSKLFVKVEVEVGEFVFDCRLKRLLLGGSFGLEVFRVLVFKLISVGGLKRHLQLPTEKLVQPKKFTTSSVWILPSLNFRTLRKFAICRSLQLAEVCSFEIVRYEKFEKFCESSSWSSKICIQFVGRKV